MPFWVRPQTLYLSACPAAGRQGWAGLGGGCLGAGLLDPGGVQRQPAGAHRRPAQHRWGPCCRCRRRCCPRLPLVLPPAAAGAGPGCCLFGEAQWLSHGAAAGHSTGCPALRSSSPACLPCLPLPTWPSARLPALAADHISKDLLQYYQRLLASQPSRRLNPKQLLEAGVLRNRLAEASSFLDNLAIKDSTEKARTKRWNPGRPAAEQRQHSGGTAAAKRLSPGSCLSRCEPKRSPNATLLHPACSAGLSLMCAGHVLQEAAQPAALRAHPGGPAQAAAHAC